MFDSKRKSFSVNSEPVSIYRRVLSTLFPDGEVIVRE